MKKAVELRVLCCFFVYFYISAFIVSGVYFTLLSILRLKYILLYITFVRKTARFLVLVVIMIAVLTHSIFMYQTSVSQTFSVEGLLK